MTPLEAIRATGRRRSWLTTQLGIERTYLWRLLCGQRPWTPDLRKRFALAVGLSEDALDFAQGCPGAAQDASDVGADSPVPYDVLEVA